MVLPSRAVSPIVNENRPRPQPTTVTAALRRGRRSPCRPAPNEPPATGPRINVPQSARDMLHEVRLTRSNLEAQVERLEQIDAWLVILAKLAGLNLPAPRVLGTAPLAYSLFVKPRPDGSAEFSIDGGSGFVLGPRLAGFFKFMASGSSAPGDDGHGNWRSRAETVQFLRESAAREVPARYVNNLVHLLRKALRKAGYDRNLIQTHRQKGVRLALKPRP